MNFSNREIFAKLAEINKKFAESYFCQYYPIFS